MMRWGVIDDLLFLCASMLVSSPSPPYLALRRFGFLDQTFKRRWFALSADGTLRYGQSPDGEVKVDCSLFDVEGVHPSTSADKRNKLHFVFEFGDEVVATFYAASESERLQWVDACLAVNPAIALLDTAS